MSLFKRITQSVFGAAVAPAVAVVAIGYAAYRTNLYIANRADLETNRRATSTNSDQDPQSITYNGPINAPTSCSSHVSAEVSGIRSQADNYDKRISIIQAGLNSATDKTMPFYRCAKSSAATKISTQIPTMRAPQILCPSSLTDQSRYLNQSKQIHDQIFNILQSTPQCKALADAVNSLAPITVAGNQEACVIDPAVAEISAEADRTWDGIKKLELKVSNAQIENQNAQVRFNRCTYQARARGLTSETAGCRPVKPTALLECITSTDLNGPLNKIRGLSRIAARCRANYDQEYSDRLQMKEYEAGLLLAMSGKEACKELASILASGPIPQRSMVTTLETPPENTVCQGSDCHSNASNAVK